MAGGEVRDGVLWQLPPYEDPPAVDIYVVTNPRSRPGRAERLFLESLIARAGVHEQGALELPGNRRLPPRTG